MFLTKSIWKLMLSVGVILIFNQGYAHTSDNEINFVWNPYCPYTCKTEVEGQPGFAMEIVQKVYQDSKFKAVYTEVNSWNRAMQMVKTGKSDAIVFSFYPNDLEASYFAPKETISGDQFVAFAVLKDNPWVLTDVMSLNKLNQIGIYKDTVWGDPAFVKFQRENPDNFTLLHGEHIIERAFDLLKLGRIDAWEDADIILRYQIHKRNADYLRIERFPTSSTSKGSALFSRKNPRAAEYTRFFDERVKQLRESGELNKILKKYGL